MEKERVMRNNWEKIAGICFLIAPMCYFISGGIGIMSYEKKQLRTYV